MRTKGLVLGLALFCFALFMGYELSFADQGLMPVTAMPKRELLLFEEIPMVTSASRRPESLLKAPAAISVINSEDIENMDYVNLWDFFRRVPGVDVLTFDGRGGSVAPRGFTERFTRRNQILIDGRSAYTPLYGGIEWDYLPLFPEDIERIEVIRGPNATLYGANSFTGVINIITKEAKDTKGLMIKESFGSHGYERDLVRYGGSAGKLDYRLGYAFHHDDGYGSRMGKDINDWEKDHTISWRSKYDIDDNSNLELLLGDKEDTGRPVGVNATSTQIYSHIRSDYQLLKYNTKVFEDQDLYLQVFRNELYENKNGNVIMYDRNDSVVKQYDFELQHAFGWLKEKMKTVWGAGFRYNDGRNYIFDATSAGPGATGKRYGGDPFIDRIYRLFINNDYEINKYWTFVFGTMLEYNGFTSGAASPRFSLLFSPKENEAYRLTYARAYRTPTMIEDHQKHTAGGVTTLGNSGLKKETVDAYEFGYTTWVMDNKLKLGAQAYLNEYKNIQDIFLRSGPGGPGSVYSSDNSNSARAKGIELESEFHPKDWVKLYANLTVQDIRDKNLDFKKSSPKFKANLGSRFKLDKLGMTANFDGYYVDTYNSKDLEDVLDTILKVKPYIRFDFRVAKTFLKGDLEWAVKGENLFDQSHVEAWSGTSAGSRSAVDIERAVYTTVTAKF